MPILKAGNFKESGLTLIELVVALAIIAFMFGIVVFAYDGASAALKDYSAKLQGTIRYTYNEAAIQGSYFRLHLNLNENTIQVEKTELTSIQSLLDPDALKEEVVLKSSEEKSESNDENVPPDPEQSFTQEQSFLLKPIHLPSSIKIKDVYLERLGEKVESGEVNVYFFPEGWVEKAVINLCNEDDAKCYSIEIF